MISAAIFDLDGTLADTLPGIASSLNRALTSLGFPTHPAERVRTFIGNGSWKLAQRALGNTMSDAEVDAVYRGFMEEYAEGWRGGSDPYAGIPELLSDLQRADVPLAVLSNKPHRFTVEIIAEVFREVSFRSVHGQREGEPSKPDPTGALAVASELGFPPGEIVLIGDSTVDFETAQAAGMQSLLVTWGFHSLERLAATKAPLVNSPEELRKFLPVPHPAE